MPNGPLKIILIHAGKYDYAEVELDGTLQIVGPNNTGKTTLINTLQFLYIDDLRRMDFGPYSAEQTRQYYFPNQYSYVLFECQAAQGQCVVGWRGQSKASGADPERFFCRGPFKRDNFFDAKGQVHEPRDVNARLALVEYQTIKSAQQHREVLLTARTPGSPGLGIVSLRENDKYHQFRETLKNLLSLSTITQDQMRARLLMLAEIPAEAVALDARQLFGEDYDLIHRRRDALLRFKKHADTVGRLVGQFEERESARSALIFLWTDLRARRQLFEKDHEEKLARLRAGLEEEVQREARLNTDLQAGRATESQLREQKGALNSALDTLAAREKEFASFVEEIERQGLQTLEAELARLRRQLDEAETEPPALVEKRLAGARAMVEQKESSLHNFDRLLVTELRKSFSDEDLDRLFSVLNFELLEYPVGSDGVVLRDATALESSLRTLLGRIHEGAYADAQVTVQLRPTHRHLSELDDVATVREELEEWRRTQARLIGTLHAIREREQIEASWRGLKSQREAKARRIVLFEEFTRAKAGEPGLRAERNAVEKSLAAVTARIQALEKELREAQEKQRTYKGLTTKAENEYNAVMGRFGLCRFPEFSAEARTLEGLSEDFDTAIGFFLQQQQAEADLAGEVTNRLREVELLLGESFIGLDDHETIRNLEAELEALPDKEDALARDWNAHLHGLKSTFDQVLKELTEVRSAADLLNRQFKAVQVSNLKSIHLDPMEHSDHVTWIRRLAEMEQPSLFDDDRGLEATLKNFRQKLESNPVIRYTDLFTLRFTVVGEDDLAHHYQDFKQIESHGTTITIKVLFNLLVLKSLLRKDDCQVPFFLDEIQALDEANRRAILNTARRLGFIAITAAPDAVGEVDALYYLQPRKGRVILGGQHRYRIRQDVPPQ